MKISINLNGLIRCPFQLLLDIADAFPTLYDQLKIQTFNPICDLNTTNDWINFEALGNASASRAKELTDFCMDYLNQQKIKSLSLHINILETDLSDDNLYSLFFLAEQLTTLELYFYVNSNKQNGLQQLLAPLMQKNNVIVYFYRDMHPIANDHIIELRNKRIKLLNDYGYLFNDQNFILSTLTMDHIGIICQYAWTCLKAGAYELACRLFEFILQHSNLNNQVQEHCFMHLQLIRFLSHQYLSITNEVFPCAFSYLNETDLCNLYFIKAYSATLCRNLNIASVYFTKAKITEHMALADEASIYQLNAYALFLEQKGEVKAALQLEIRIEEFMNSQRIETTGLKYINFINIARIYTRTNQYNNALASYEKGYKEISRGGFTKSDHIHYNLNLAILYEFSGNLQAALFFWIKVGLHWVTYGNQYALSWRPRLILSQEKVEDILKPISTERVNQFLVKKINNLITQLKINLNLTKQQKQIHFIHNASANLKKEACYINQNIILYQCVCNHNKNVHLKNNSSLVILLSHLLRQLLDMNDDREISLMIDEHFENIFPETLADLMHISIVSGSHTFYVKGKRIEIKDHHKKEFYNRVNFNISKLVTKIEFTENKAHVFFRRSFLNQMLNSALEVELIKQLTNRNKVDFIQCENTIIKLIKQNILSLDYKT